MPKGMNSGRKQNENVYDHELILLLLETHTPSEVAAEVGCNARTVLRVAQKQRGGEPLPYNKRHPPETKARALTLLEDGTGYAEAGRTLGISKSVISKWYPGMGMDPVEAGMLARVLHRHGGKI